jgi:hypothetical protein
VTHDKDAAWDAIAKHAVHETNAYASWLTGQAGAKPFAALENEATIRADPSYRVAKVRH